MNHLRNTLFFAFYIISSTLVGQTNNYEQLFYDLAARTIQDLGSSKNEIRLVRIVTTPTEIWDNQKKEPITGTYFTGEDLETISRQIENPIIETWDVDMIMKLSNVRLISKPRGNNCLTISLPIISRDGLTIVIFYQLLDKRAGAGFATVWRKTKEGSWKVEKHDALWITRLQVPAHNTVYAP